MTDAAVVRLVEAFFRRWPLHFYLVVASLILGFVYVGRSADEFQAKGTILVESQSLVSTQSGIQVNANYSYLTPAQFTSQEMAGLIATDVFMVSMLSRAGIELQDDVSMRDSQLFLYRQTLYVFPTSGNIVQLGAITDDAQLSADLTVALIDEFIEYHIGADKAESDSSVAFFSELVERYQADLDAARSDVDRALGGRDEDDELTLEEELTVERLRGAESEAADRYQAAIDNVETARLAELQTNTDIDQSYVVLDSGLVPTEPLGRRLNDLMNLAMFAAVGVIAALATTLFSALGNQNIMFPDDIEARTDLLVVASVPRVSRRLRDLKRAATADTESQETSLHPEILAWKPEPLVAPNDQAIAPSSSPKNGWTNGSLVEQPAKVAPVKSTGVE